MDHMLHNRQYEDYFQDHILTIRNERFVFAIKSAYRSKMPGIIHDQSASGATLFIEPLSLVEKITRWPPLKQLTKKKFYGFYLKWPTYSGPMSHI